MSYNDISARLSHHRPEDIGRAIRDMQTGNPVSGAFAGDERALGELRSLMFGTEVQRDQRNLVFSAMAHGLLASGQADSLDDVLSIHPAAQQDAMSGFRQVSRELRGRDPMTGYEHRALARSAAASGQTTDQVGAEARRESRRRQIEILRRWFSVYVAGRTDAGNLGDLEEYIMDWLRNYYGRLT